MVAMVMESKPVCNTSQDITLSNVQSNLNVVHLINQRIPIPSIVIIHYNYNFLSYNNNKLLIPFLVHFRLTYAEKYFRLIFLANAYTQ